MLICAQLRVQEGDEDCLLLLTRHKLLITLTFCQTFGKILFILWQKFFNQFDGLK